MVAASFFAAPAYATTYEIGPGKDYETLEALRTANVLASGDEIVLYGNDSTLAENFLLALNGGAITIKSNDGTVRTVTGANTSGNYGGVFNFIDAAILNLDSIDFKDNKGKAEFGGAIYTNVASTINGTDLFFTGNSAIRNSGQGGAIWAAVGLTFNAGNYSFSANKAEGSGQNSGRGGAIHAGQALTFAAGDYSFSGNSATGTGDHSGQGGAIYADQELTFTAGDYSFSGNSAAGGDDGYSGRGGAIYVGNTLTFTAGDYSFSDNKAIGGTGDNSGQGGAIHAGQALTFAAGDYSFSGNSAEGNGRNSGQGGAIHAGQALTFAAGDYSFIGNSATGTGDNSGSGGAIYADFTLTITKGSYDFIDNKATGSGTGAGLGGAIYVTQGAAFIADGGDITFQSNTQGDGINSYANAIYFANGGTNDELNIAAFAGQKIEFFDPIESNSANPNLKIDINKTSALNVGDGPYLGTVVFDGSYWAEKGSVNPDDFTSKIYGNTTVHNGTMALKHGVTYSNTSTDAGWGKFTVGAAATLLSDIGGNTVQAGTITLQDGSILAFDMTGADGVTQSTTNLTLDGTFTDPTITVDLREISGLTLGSTYNLVSATGITDTNKTLTIYGEAIAGTRAAGAFSLSSDSDTLKLTKDNNITNYVRYWNEDAGDWDTTTQNWRSTNGGTAISDADFFHGDAVVFGGVSDHATGGTVTIRTDGVEIAAQGANPGMEIAAGDWTFTGGEIFGGEISFTGTGSLTLDGVNGGTTREMHQRITSTTAWIAPEIKAAPGATVVFADKSTTSSGGAISFANANSPLVFGSGGVGTGGAFVFRDNKAEADGAWNGNGGAISTGGALTLNDADYTFSGNSASSTAAGHGWGGAICAFGALEFTDGTYDFTENKASGAGGAVYAYTTLKFADGTYDFKKNESGISALLPGSGGAIYAKGALEFTTGVYDFTENSVTRGNGGAIHANTTLTFKNGDFDFTENSASYGSGGAVYAATALEFTAGTYDFTGNFVTRGNGGAIFANTTLTFTDGNFDFTENFANYGDGGAIYAEGALIFDEGNYTFSNNFVWGSSYNGGGHGGAIYSADTLTFTDGDYAFSDNSATGGGDSVHGGAIYAAGTLTFTDGDYTFSGNSATSGWYINCGFGGAIYAGGTLNLLSGTYDFSGNSATSAYSSPSYPSGLGGAIYALQDATLVADGGDITFRGNVHNNGANAIYLANNGGGKTLNLAAKAGRSIFFYDPIENHGDLTIDINKTGTVGADTYTGSVIFDGSYWVGEGKNPTDDPNYFTSGVRGATTVYNGTLALKNGATYGAVHDGSSFTLASGATLSASGATNTVQTDTITLDTGSTLAFDLAGAVSKTTAQLAFNGGTYTNKIGTQKIDVTDTATILGTDAYLLASAAAGQVATTGTLYYNDVAQAAPTRGGTVAALTTNATQSNLYVQNVTLAATGNTLHWNGTTTASNWNKTTTNKNWLAQTGSNYVAIDYIDAENVVFDANAASKAVNVAVAVAPANMTVSAAGYEFTGFAINGTGTLAVNESVTFKNQFGFTGGVAVASGKALTVETSAAGWELSNVVSGDGALTKTGSNVLTLSGENTYTGGTTVSAGTLRIGNGGTSGSVAGDIVNNAAVVFNRSNAITYSDVISGSGSVTQSGSGTLTLSGSNSYEGGTTINAGKLAVSANANLGAATGTLTINAGKLSATDTFTTDRAVTLGNAASGIEVAANKTLTLSGTVGGTGGSLTKTGTGTLTLSGAVNVKDLTVSTGKLTLSKPVTLQTGGKLTVNAGLGISATNSPAVTATNVAFGAGASLDITGYSGTYGETNPVTLISSTNAITGNLPGSYMIGGTVTPGFATAQLAYSTDNKELLAKIDLIWFDKHTNGSGNFDKAHGTFDIATSFELGTDLTDRTGTFTSGWDGNSLTKNGNGTLILTKDNSYTGDTTVSAGTLQIGSGGTTGSVAGDIVNNANVVFNRSDEYIFSKTISGSGTTTQSGGTLNLAAAAVISTDFVQNSGTLKTTNGETLNAATFKGTVTPTGTLNVTSATFDGATVKLSPDLTTDKIVASGSIAFVNDTTIKLAPSTTITGDTDYHLMTGSSISGLDKTVADITLGTNQRGGLYLADSNTKLMYGIVIGSTSMTWNGSGTWSNSQTDTNWSTGTFNTYFKEGDDVTFKAGQGTVAVTGTVKPKDITLETGADYQFTNGKIEATGKVDVKAGATLGLQAGNTPALKANSVDFNTTGSLDISEYTPNESSPWPNGGNPQTVIETTTGTIDNFDPANLTILGQTSVDFLKATGSVDSTGKKLNVETVLSWNLQDGTAHGDFTIADGKTFTLNAPLTAQTAIPSGWDGKSLTKKGEGTLVLTGSNTTDGDFNHNVGGVELQSNWNGTYRQASGTSLKTQDGVSIGKTGTTSQLNGTVNPNGTLNVAGDLELNAESNLKVGLVYNGGPATSDKVVASGEITLNGGTLTIDDNAVNVQAIREASAPVDFVVLESGSPGQGNFGTVTGYNSNFFSTEWGWDANRYLFTVAYNDQTKFTDYSWNHNTNEIARNLDASMKDPAMQDLINGIIGDDARILAGLDTLRGIELAADAQAMALWNPWDIVYKRLYSEDNRRQSCDPCAPCGKRSANRDAWVEGYYRDTDVRRDGNASKYDGRRGGTMVGLDTRLGNRSKIGVVFGYGEPRVSNRFGKIEADDYTFGLYSKVRVVDNVYANAFLGYGSQRYESSRTDIAGLHRAKYDGDSMYASLEFFRPLNWRRNMTLFPLFALDYQRSWTDGFTESGDYGQKVKRAEMDRFVMRIGLNSKIRWNDRLNVSTRLQYGYLLGGDVHGVARTQFAAASPTSPVMGLRGVNLGRNQFNVGLGGEWKLTHRTRLFGDYDFDLGDRSTSHTGQFGLVTNW